MPTSTNPQSISRRRFLQYSALLSASAVGFAWLPACAVDPVTGRRQVMMVSEQQEIAIDKQQSPFQFSSDYGITQDSSLNQYVSRIGQDLVPHVHRPNMPYAFQCVNATYINAYAFPGGSIAVTRGILLKLKNEAELAALLGHELGHVNARHTAEQVSKSQLSSLLIGGLSIAAATQGSALGELTQQLGALGQGIFLSKYSRDNEREADALGNEYMVRAGYGSRGFSGLMEMLNSLHKEQPSSSQMLFSTHPMSSERLDSALQREREIYRNTANRPLNRERYMDETASLRAKKQAIEWMQEGEKHMDAKDYDKAEASFKKALSRFKDDYTGHVLMAKCQMLKKNSVSALSYANTAKAIYPTEVQGYYLAGLANADRKKFADAYRDFARCDEILPGNPQMAFFKGYSLENSRDRKGAAENYMKYLKMVDYQSNKYSQHAYTRLKEWGYVK